MRALKRLLLLCLVALMLLAPLSAMAAGYELTPAEVSYQTVRDKLTALGYLEEDGELEAAIVAFQSDHPYEEKKTTEIKKDGVMDRRTLVRIMAEDVLTPIPVFVPVYTGKRYHIHMACSGMDDPELVDITTATLLGFTPCQHCYRITD